MTVTRRGLLGLLALSPWLPACNPTTSPLTQKMKGVPMQPISPEEIEVLTNPLARPAWLAKHNLPQGQHLEITGRVFGGERGLLRSKDLKDVRFVNCVFEMFQGYDNNLENVHFIECQFLGGEFSGPRWKNVSLSRCEAEGPFKIGCADGDVSFENCTLRGMTAKEGGYGHWADHFGLATGGDGRVRFVRCQLENLVSFGETETRLADCKIGDFRGSILSHRGTLVIENCQCLSEQNKHDFGGSKGFSQINIRNSKLGLVDLKATTAELIEVTGSSLSLETGTFKGHFGKAVFRDSHFFGKGLWCPLVPQIDSWVLENCTFSASDQRFQLFGEPNDQPPTLERGPIYWTRIRELTLRNQKLTKANMAYLQVGTFTVDNSSLEDCDLSHGHFGTWRFVNARLAGSLDLSETTIQRIDNQGLIQNAKVTGKLEASPDAPAPELQPPAVPSKGNKKS